MNKTGHIWEISRRENKYFVIDWMYMKENTESRISPLFLIWMVVTRTEIKKTRAENNPI